MCEICVAHGADKKFQAKETQKVEVRFALHKLPLNYKVKKEKS